MLYCVNLALLGYQVTHRYITTLLQEHADYHQNERKYTCCLRLILTILIALEEHKQICEMNDSLRPGVSILVMPNILALQALRINRNNFPTANNSSLPEQAAKPAYVQWWVIYCCYRLWQRPNVLFVYHLERMLSKCMKFHKKSLCQKFVRNHE